MNKMETAQENKDWGLVHTPNGEWIYEYNVEFVTDEIGTIYQYLAKKQGKELPLYRISENLFWCYRHQLDSLGLGKPRALHHKSNDVENNDNQ